MDFGFMNFDFNGLKSKSSNLLFPLIYVIANLAF